MGLQIIVKNEDFSAIRVGKIGLYTSISSELMGLFCLSSVFGEQNFNFGSGVDAATVGVPPVSANGVTSDQSNYIDFKIIPSGSRTMAFVLANDGTTNKTHFSSFAPAPTYGEYTRLNGTNLNFESSKNTTMSSPSAVRDEMALVVINNKINTNLYIPRTGGVVTYNTATPQDTSTGYRTSINVAGTAASRSMLFAYWNRALSSAEINTFYTEMKSQLAALGVANI